GERESYPIDLGQPETLDDALMAALGNLSDTGQVLAIQYSHAGRRKHTLWQFRATRSRHKGFWRPAYDGGKPVFIGKLEAKPLLRVELDAPFQPREPFDAFRDDPVGVDRGLVQLQAEWDA